MRNLVHVGLNTILRFAGVGMVALGVVGTAKAQYTSSDPTFPPAGISFESTDSVDFGSTSLNIDGASIWNFVGSQEYSTLTSGEFFDSQNVSFLADINNAPTLMTGDFKFEITSVPGTLLGTYGFSIVGLDVTGGGDTLTLDSSRASSGTSVIGDVGGGFYSVDPTFTLYTELNGNAASGGTGSDGSMHFNDVLLTPEPVTMGLGLAGIGLYLRRRIKTSA